MAKKILVVDDEPEITEMLSLRLEENGYEVITAFSGPEAIAKTRSEKPDLILLDYTLPKMRGDEVCQQIKSDMNFGHIRIILLSAYRQEEISVGNFADAFVGKPYDAEELLNKIEELLR